MNLGELRFLEVRGDPDPCIGDDAHQRLAGTYELANFDLLARDFARSRRSDFGVIELQLCVRCGGTCRQTARARNANTCFSSVNGAAGGGRLTLGGEQVRVGDIGLRLRGVEHLLGDDLLRGELPGASEIRVSLVGVGAGGTDLRIERSALTRGALNLRLRLSGET